MLESPEKTIHELYEGCDRLIEHPPTVNEVPDRFIPLFATAFKTVLPQHPPAEAAIEYAVEANKAIKPYSGIIADNQFLRLIQKENLRNPRYPFQTLEEWEQELHTLFEDEERTEIMTQNMQMWDIGSDVETRAAGPKLVAHTLLAERANDEFNPITMLSVGAARNHGLAMIVGNVPFPKVRMETDQRVPRKLRPFYQARVNELLARHVEMGPSTGLDLWPIRDTEWSEWLEACRYYPSELRDLEKRKRYLQLEDIRDSTPYLEHVDDDFSLDVNLGKTYDLIFFSTSLYQNLEHEQRRMFSNAIRHLNPGGIIVVQDFCNYRAIECHDSHPLAQIKFVDPAVKPYTYRTLVYDPEKREAGLQPFMVWNNGRCEAFKAGRLLLDKLLSTYPR